MTENRHYPFVMMESSIDRIIARSRDVIASPGWGIKRFADFAGMPYTTMCEINKENFDPKASTLRKLERAIGCINDDGSIKPTTVRPAA